MADGGDCTAAATVNQPSVNIVNTLDVEAFVEGFARQVRRPEGRHWCRRNLRKFLMREPRLALRIGRNDVAALLRKAGVRDLPAWIRDALAAGRPLHWFAPHLLESWDDTTDFIQAIFNVVEWIEALPDDDRRWRQFHKMGVPDAIAAARAWQQRRADDDRPEDWSAISTVMRFADGVKFVSLTSAAALAREGQLMSHCVASYAGRVAKDSSEIYSLRDTRNRPQVTIEVRGDRVVQLKGKRNLIPADRWLAYVEAFVSFMGWGTWNRPPGTRRFVYQGRTYTDAAEVIADLPQLVDLDAAAFDYTQLTPILQFIARVQRGATGLAVEHQRALVAMLQARITANGGYRLCRAAEVALELPRGSIVETRVELAGAAFALAAMGALSAAREEVTDLCRQIGRNVLDLIEKRPAVLYRLGLATGGPPAARGLAEFIAAAGLADDLYGVRRVSIQQKRNHIAATVFALRHRLVDHRTSHLISDGERAKAIRLIRVQAPRFCDRTLRDAFVA
jgi:hypothetical protein